MSNLVTDSAFASYIETALWSSIDEMGVPLNEIYAMDDIMYLDHHRSECENFLTYLEDTDLLEVTLSEQTLETILHDFWLTRNGHGAGFWDGDYTEDLGKKLTRAAHTFSGVDLYVWDDNKIYYM